MKINYPESFYKQHHYNTSVKNGSVVYTDNKWDSINKRYNSIIDKHNEHLISNQPFSVISNDKGFDMLIELMTLTNYSFDDVDDALYKTYQQSLENAISRELVNNQSVIFSCTNNDTSVVSSDNIEGYFVVDVPFNQMHFGERDKIIRQQIQKIFISSHKNYIPMKEFLSKEISDLLDFTLICTVNGFICNDCFVALSDNGFKFKIKWGYSSDVTFIIYKLDESFVHLTDIQTTDLVESEEEPRNVIIPYDKLNIPNDEILNHIECCHKCIVNIYDENFLSTVPSVPNFGYFTKDGFVVSNIQNRTFTDIERLSSTTLTLVIYGIKYLHEVPNVFPAVNYYDLIDSRKIYTNNILPVKNVDGKNILASSEYEINIVDKCTPPILLDRPISSTFDTIVDCINLHDELMKFEDTFILLGNAIIDGFVDKDDYQIKVINRIDDIYYDFQMCYVTFNKGAMLTSLISSELVHKFQDVLNGLTNLKTLKNINEVELYTFGELYGLGYRNFVDTVTKPYMDESLLNLKDINKLNVNYFDNNDIDYKHFVRPVSEQSFICLKYNKTEDCWLFDTPNIRRFTGIGNSFYINENLSGDEIFKLFVLFTDTETVGDKQTELEISQDVIFDFDRFYVEMNKHLGCIRYWYIENMLLKLSKILYNDTSPENTVHVLSRILNKKIENDDLLYGIQSVINYENSNITTSNIDEWTKDSVNAPFAVNFLFYTLSLVNGNEDKLRDFFLYKLTDDKFNNRYVDIDISDLYVLDIDIGYAYISGSKLTKFPDMPIIQTWLLQTKNTYFVASADNVILAYHNKPEIDGFDLPYKEFTDVNAYDELPFVLDKSGIARIEPYKYLITPYEQNTEFPSVIPDNNSKVLSTKTQPRLSVLNDFNTCEYLCVYLCHVYDYLGELQLNYVKTFNCVSIIESAIETLNKDIQDINVIYKKNNPYMTQTLVDTMKMIVSNNTFVSWLKRYSSAITKVISLTYNGRNVTIFDFISKFASYIYTIHRSIGFDNYSEDKVNILYNHLIKITKPMSLYTYEKWLRNIDIDVIDKLNDILADNENYDIHDNTFTSFANALKKYLLSAYKNISDAKTIFDEIENDIHPNHIKPITDTIISALNISGLKTYDIDRISFDKNRVYTSKPVLMYFDIDSNDKHLFPGLEYYHGLTWNLVKYGDDTSNYIMSRDDDIDSYIMSRDGYTIGKFTLLFKVNSYKDGQYYKISSITPLTKYAFFNGQQIKFTNTADLFTTNDGLYVATNDGKKLTYQHMDITNPRVIDKDGEFIKNIDLTITFKQLGQLADSMDDIYSSNPDGVTIIDIPNIHEANIDVIQPELSILETNDTKFISALDDLLLAINEKTPRTGMIVSSVYSKMNYELLMHNRYMQLSHTHQLIESEQNITTPVDRVEIPNDIVSQIAVDEYKKRGHFEMYFKPSYVLHITPIDGKIIVKGSKYRPGQKIYLSTYDNYIFPCIVSAIAPSHDSGFVECYVVHDECKWLKVTDVDKMINMLKYPVQCRILEDNVTNYLNEFNDVNYDINSYDYGEITDLQQDTHKLLPGDPIFVNTNQQRVVNRLSWFLSQTTANRFIDDEHKLYKFVYVGHTFFDGNDVNINMLNVDMNTLSEPEIYSVLRSEPDDHSIWNAEINEFNRALNVSHNEVLNFERAITIIEDDIKHATSDERKKELEYQLYDMQNKLQREYQYQDRITSYIEQLEQPTTWFNVNGYDDGIVYINNGRAKINPMTINMKTLLRFSAMR